jgi:hypothetical protein
LKWIEDFEVLIFCANILLAYFGGGWFLGVWAFCQVVHG